MFTQVGFLLPLIILIQICHAQQCSNSSKVYRYTGEDDLKDVYTIIIDAGSTGSRMNILRFKRDIRHSTGLELIDIFRKAVNPGLSAFRSKDQVSASLSPMIAFAQTKIPKKFFKQTAISIRATAGLRLVAKQRRRKLKLWSTEVLKMSPFKALVKLPVRIISGTEEAQYGWMSVNTLLDKFDIVGTKTMGTLEVGGGSMQICFAHTKIRGPVDTYFSTLGGKEFNLHCISYLGLGASAAAMAMFGYDKTNPSNSPDDIYESPCVHPEFEGEFKFGSVRFQLKGTQNRSSEVWRSCLAQMEEVVAAKNVSSVGPFIRNMNFTALGQFYYQAFGLGRKEGDLRRFQVKDYLRKAKDVCKNPPKKGRYKVLKCVNLMLVYSLLKAFGFQDKQYIFTANEIRGVDPGWPLGAAIHYLTEEQGAHIVLSVPSNYMAPNIKKLKVICRVKCDTQPRIKWIVNNKIFKVVKAPMRISTTDYKYKSTVIFDTKKHLNKVKNTVKCVGMEILPSESTDGCTSYKESITSSVVKVSLPDYECKSFKTKGLANCRKVHKNCVLRQGIFTAYSSKLCCCMKIPTR